MKVDYILYYFRFLPYPIKHLKSLCTAVLGCIEEEGKNKNRLAEWIEMLTLLKLSPR